ncbi:MAG: LuxR C-terminal-related transcriptional regulator [Gammaproteobacteria bacterium]|nr:LuxR C-terminal-related transcriptional regulator [Gammaproteobacteria bacterium]MBU1722415.1 LuxR C-terminal-related transcriptional regulator [Gammaproteobacteria bacterium]MBU2004648.1 LuxR C-terminal-related transcriptional regulator [Gammaproteobacteria bacterium]
MFQTKELLIIAFLLIVGVLHTYGFSLDLRANDRSILHLSVDALVVLISFAGVGYLMWENQRKHREIETLNSQLRHSHTRISDLHQKLQQAGKGYLQLIHQQLDEWELSPTEKEIALLLLKGLSFEEIASIRNTKEKTVRQQAISVYRKSGLNGRHEFAGWFFEDFLG